MWKMQNTEGVQSAISLVTVSKQMIKGMNEGNLKWGNPIAQPGRTEQLDRPRRWPVQQQLLAGASAGVPQRSQS